MINLTAQFLLNMYLFQFFANSSNQSTIFLIVQLIIFFTIHFLTIRLFIITDLLNFVIFTILLLNSIDFLLIYCFNHWIFHHLNFLFPNCIDIFAILAC